jgi:hypothetical protein
LGHRHELGGVGPTRCFVLRTEQRLSPGCAWIRRGVDTLAHPAAIIPSFGRTPHGSVVLCSPAAWGEEAWAASGKESAGASSVTHCRRGAWCRKPRTPCSPGVTEPTHRFPRVTGSQRVRTGGIPTAQAITRVRFCGLVGFSGTARGRAGR